MSSLNKQQRVINPGELTLALNTAEGRLQFALGRVAAGAKRGPEPAALPALELLAAQDWLAASQGAELLAPALQQTLRNLKLDPGHIGRVAIVNGPGSFTGLRLACVTASALTRAVGAVQAGLEYLPLLASGVVAAGLSTEAHSESRCQIWVLTYARRGLVYLQGFAAEGGAEAALAELPVSPGLHVSNCAASATDEGGEAATFLPGLLKADALQAFGLAEAAAYIGEGIREAHGRHVALGSGLSRNLSEFGPLLHEHCPGLHLLPGFFDQPAPELLLRAAFGLRYSYTDVSPLYVRPSDAEENLPHLAARLGLDADFAVSKLAELLRGTPDQQ